MCDTAVAVCFGRAIVYEKAHVWPVLPWRIYLPVVPRYISSFSQAMSLHRCEVVNCNMQSFKTTIGASPSLVGACILITHNLKKNFVHNRLSLMGLKFVINYSQNFLFIDFPLLRNSVFWITMIFICTMPPARGTKVWTRTIYSEKQGSNSVSWLNLSSWYSFEFEFSLLPHNRCIARNFIVTATDNK